MTRGTTPTHTFTTDVDLSEATAIYVTYQQEGVNLVEKTLDDITFIDGKFQVTLTQNDTLLFSSDKTKKIYIQVRAVLSDGTRIASNIIRTDIHAILKDGAI